MSKKNATAGFSFCLIELFVQGRNAVKMVDEITRDFGLKFSLKSITSMLAEHRGWVRFGMEQRLQRIRIQGDVKIDECLLTHKHPDDFMREAIPVPDIFGRQVWVFAII